MLSLVFRFIVESLPVALVENPKQLILLSNAFFTALTCKASIHSTRTRKGNLQKIDNDSLIIDLGRKKKKEKEKKEKKRL